MFEFLLCLKLKGGFLAEQDEPATKGNRDLRYDVDEGMFKLTTESYAKIHCEMDFTLYLFDTQRCIFQIRTTKDISHQVRTG